MFDLLRQTPAIWLQDMCSLEPEWDAIGLTIGGFRCLHSGHQALISALARGCKARKLPAGVVNFQPTAYEVLSRKRWDPMINPQTRRLLLASWGVRYAIQHAMDKNFLLIEPEEFVERVLLKTLRVKYLVVGDDFCFGHRRRGNIDLLNRYQRGGDLVVEQVQSIRHEGARISTTQVYQALTEQNYDGLQYLLGRPWCLVGRVCSGRGWGTRVEKPTINVELPDRYCAPNGVYAGLVELPGSGVYRAAINIGTRPTFTDSNKRVLEALLLDRKLTNRPVEIAAHLLQRIRSECKFDSPQALIRQIDRDLVDIRHYFAQTPVPLTAT